MFKYRGQRISKSDLHGYGFNQFLLMIPSLIVVSLYGYFIVYPLVESFLESNNQNYFVFVVPVLIISGILIGSYLCVFMISRWSYSRNGYFSRLSDRKKLANMIVDNRFYKETRKQEKDISTGRVKTVIKIKLPKVYYKRGKGNIISVFFPLDGNKNQRRFLELSSELENMFFADNMAILTHKGYVEYQLFTNVLQSRINVKEVKATPKGITLMKGVVWNFDSLPHLLIGGGTGGGKTYLLMSLILGLLEVGEVEVCDPKDSDLMALGTLPVFENKVYTGKAIIGCLRKAQVEMVKRFKFMKESKTFSMGKNYSHYGLKPKFVIIDEWAAFITELEADPKGRELVIETYAYLTQLILKARQAGIFIILAMQRPDTSYLKGSLRDNFMYRMSVGDLSSDGYNMIFGELNRGKNFKSKPDVKGHGYVAEGGGFAHEFYSPFVDSDFNFYEAFSKFGKQESFDSTVVQLNATEYKELLNDMDKG